MALIVQRDRPAVSQNANSKPLMCFTCKERKTGKFTTDHEMKPQCGDCAAAIGRPIP